MIPDPHCPWHVGADWTASLHCWANKADAEHDVAVLNSCEPGRWAVRHEDEIAAAKAEAMNHLVPAKKKT